MIARLNQAVIAALADPTNRQKFIDQGFEIPQREEWTPDALIAMQRAEIERWWPIIRAANIKAE